MIKNSKGKIYYGMHFYPGVAEYQEPGKEPYRVYLNEDTIRGMDASFAGRPVFVDHVDEVDEDVNELRKDADGWVVESFFNQADGKHWVKFMIVSDQAEKAIQSGMRLSNAYVPHSFGKGGLWNGVSYLKEVTGGEFEHLALVRNPRYDESDIKTPEEFKLYNENLLVELKRVSNSKDLKDQKGENKMKLNIFKRTKVENSKDVDFEELSVKLPKSGKELTLAKLVEDHDTVLNMNGYANGEHFVKAGEEEMTVNQMMKKYNAAMSELAEMKAKNEGDTDELDEEGATENEDGDEGREEEIEKKKKEKKTENSSDDESSEDDKDENSIEAEKLKNALKLKADKKANFDKVKNARKNVSEEIAVVETSMDRLALGKQLF